MYYTKLKVICHADFREIFIAELSEIGFQTFEETEDGLDAYVEDEQYDKNQVEEIRRQYCNQTTLVFYFEKVKKENWNEEWEKNFHPIVVEDKILVRAGFHQPDKQYPYEVIITPKMSFGTGHHQTTYLMLKTLLDINVSHKLVMDAGCGTAILAIMAFKLGAEKVDAFDIDEWCVTNGQENIEVNQCQNVTIRQGTINELSFSYKFDVILANINKNVLLQEINNYSSILNPGGQIILSGFYEADIPDLLQEAAIYGKTVLKTDTKDNWAVLWLS